MLRLRMIDLIVFQTQHIMIITIQSRHLDLSLLTRQCSHIHPLVLSVIDMYFTRFSGYLKKPIKNHYASFVSNSLYQDSYESCKAKCYSRRIPFSCYVHIHNVHVFVNVKRLPQFKYSSPKNW